MGETETAHFYDFWISGRVPGSQTNYFLSLEKPGYLKSSKKIPNRFWKYYAGKSQKIRHPYCLQILEKTDTENPDDPSNTFLEILDMGSLSSRKHETEFGKSLKPWNQETSKPRNFKAKERWNQETLKPRNQETEKLRNQEIKKPKKTRNQETTTEQKKQETNIFK